MDTNGGGGGPGRVEAIIVRGEAGGEGVAVERARVEAGRGLEGDRYWKGAGTYSHVKKPGRDLTLVAAEALEGLLADTGIQLEAGQTGRNLLTRGVDLNALVGRRFVIGEVECVGQDLCEPCQTLERRTQPGVLRGLVGRGGLRADVLVGGEIAVGDGVGAVEDGGGPPGF